MKVLYPISVLILLFSLPFTLCAQKMTKIETALNIRHISHDFSITELSNREWRRADESAISTYWSGEKAPDGRRFKTRLLWSDTALYVRFEATQAEPLIVSEKPSLASKTLKLWDRDVCEIFIAPDNREPRKYFEFEVAPSGEWIDLTIDLTSGTRETGWDYKSRMQSTAKIEKDKVVMAIKVEWKALGKTPKTGLTGITCQRSIDGAAFAACANSAAEVSSGWYKVDLATSDLNGDEIVLHFTKAGVARNWEHKIRTNPT